MPPLKGEGDRRQAVERYAPGATLGVADVGVDPGPFGAALSAPLREQSLSLFHSRLPFVDLSRPVAYNGEKDANQDSNSEGMLL